MRIRLLTEASIELDREQGKLDLDGVETERLESNQHESIIGFGESVLATGQIATLAILLGRGTEDEVPPAVLSAQQTLQMHNGGHMAVIEEVTDDFVYWRFFSMGQGLPAMSHRHDETRTILFEASSHGMMQLLNDEAEQHGFQAMVLSGQASVLRDTNARLLLLGTLAGFTDGTRSYGSLTARASIFVDPRFTLMSLSDEAIKKLEFTHPQALLLRAAVGDTAADPEETDDGTWRIPWRDSGS